MVGRFLARKMLVRDCLLKINVQIHVHYRAPFKLQEDDLQSRVILVGGAGSLGRAVRDGLAGDGAEVIVVDLAASLYQAGWSKDIDAIAVDVSEPASVAGAFEAIGQRWNYADAMVYLSGYTLAPPRPALSIEDADWCGVIDVNLSGAFRAAKAAHPLLDAHGGSMVLVSSAMAYGPVKGFAPYIASKAGMLGLTRALASEFGPKVRVNALAPSAMETPFMAGGSGRNVDDTAGEWFSADAFKATTPLGRLATVEDCVGPIRYLIGPDAAFMTGQVMHVNGGRLMV